MQHAEQGLAIRAERLARNLTQADLAVMAGVSGKTVRRAESGERIAADSVRGICAALGLDAANLRSEAEMHPQAGREMDDRADAAAFHAKAGAATLAVSCFLTMAALVFETPAGLAGLILAVGALAATGLLLAASAAMLARPDWRESLMGRPWMRASLARIDSFDGLGLFLLCTAATPPAIGFAVSALKALVREPGIGTGLVLLLDVGLTVGLAALSVSVIGGGLVAARPSHRTHEGRA